MFPKKTQDENIFYNIRGPKQFRLGGPESEVEYYILTTDSTERSKAIDIKGLTAKLRGPGVTSNPSFVDCGNGEYRCAFTPTAPGLYNLDINVFGRNMFNEKVDVLSKDDGPSVIDFVLNELVEEKKIGEKSDFTIKVTASGNPYNADIKKMQVVLTGPEQPRVTLTGAGGNYKGSFKPFRPGTYVVDLRYDGKPALKKTGTVIYAPKAAPKKSIAHVPKSSIAGERIEFIIEARDDFNVPLKTGGDPFEVEIAGPEDGLKNANIKVVDNFDGTYTASVTLTKDGAYDIYVEVYGEGAKESPYPIVVVGH
eukprot:TRINITY_DN1838_c0_g1_i2.p1 TRINITY_DN1838_c0_g1~~TRINITY_DN1838_c0_g1_i2.p1  ORF type:complete len:310 (-),score=88.02 TRINITY_DN1838_c0_g1_i2:69-998(-)